MASYYRGAHAIALCFDTTNRISFHNVKQWLQEVERFANPSVVKILVGCKADNELHRAVTQDEAKALAKNLTMKYLECSAKTACGTDEIFCVLTKQLFEKRAQLSIAQRLPASDTSTVKQKLARTCKIDTQHSECCIIS